MRWHCIKILEMSTHIHCTLIFGESLWTLGKAAQRKLSDFTQNMIIGARWIEHSISEIVETFDISQSMVLHVYLEYLMESITAYHGQYSGQLVLNDQGRSNLARARNTRCIATRSVQHSLASMLYRSRKLTRVSQLAVWHQTQNLVWTCGIANWTLRQDPMSQGSNLGMISAWHIWSHRPLVNKAPCSLVVSP